jgi:hypothetical protein
MARARRASIEIRAPINSRVKEGLGCTMVFHYITEITAMAIASKTFIGFLQTIARLKAENEGFATVYSL